MLPQGEIVRFTFLPSKQRKNEHSINGNVQSGNFITKVKVLRGLGISIWSSLAKIWNVQTTSQLHGAQRGDYALNEQVPSKTDHHAFSVFSWNCLKVNKNSWKDARDINYSHQLKKLRFYSNQINGTRHGLEMDFYGNATKIKLLKC